MSATSKVMPALNSIKSLPPEFKITSRKVENRGDAKLKSGDATGSSSSDNDVLVGEVSEEALNHAGDVGLYDEDVAYSRKGVSLEDRSSIADEDLETVPMSFPSVSMSSRERRWSDTTPYSSKKVLLASDFN